MYLRRFACTLLLGALWVVSGPASALVISSSGAPWGDASVSVATEVAGVVDPVDFVSNLSITSTQTEEPFWICACVTVVNASAIVNFPILVVAPQPGAGADPAALPVPGTLALLGVGLAGLGVARRSKAPRAV